jgi:hypothetical protein
VYNGFSVVCHQTNKGSVPFVAAICEFRSVLDARKITYMILLKVADPEDIRTCLILLLKS